MAIRSSILYLRIPFLKWVCRNSHNNELLKKRRSPHFCNSLIVDMASTVHTF